MLTIAWDIDDVLNELMKIWLEEFWLAYHKNSTFLYTDLKENPPHQILGVTHYEYLNSLDLFRLSDKAFSMKPNEEILSWFEEKGQLFRHIALTSAPLHTAPVSSYWVTKNFGKWIQSFNFVPSERDWQNYHVYNKNKKEFLNWINIVDVLIDDNKDNIDGAEELGIKGISISRPGTSEDIALSKHLIYLMKF